MDTPVILYRLILPIRAGQFGMDESELAVRAGALLKGEYFPLIGLWGTRGVPYGPYPTYFYTLLYGLTGFHWGWAFLILNLLFLASAFLVAASVKPHAFSMWTLLLALTSPVAIYHSMMLWDNPLLIVTSALILYLARPEAARGNWRDFVIGILLGVSLGIHLMALPFIAGVVVWRILVVKQLKAVLALGLGFVISIVPYVLGLWQVRELLAIVARRAADPSMDLWSLPTSLFRFWGLHPFQFFVNVNGPFLWLEQQLGHVTLGVILALLLLTGYVIWKACVHRSLPRKSLLTAFLLCAAFYLPFAFITNSSHLLTHANAIWWFAPVVIPIVVLQVFPGRAGPAILSCLVSFNVLVTAVQCAPRMITGTSAESIDRWGYGLGASWWMQEITAREICAEAERQVQRQGLDMILVKLADVKYIAWSLPNLIKVKYPDCFAKIKWAPNSQQAYDIRVDPDADHRYLRVIGRAAIPWQVAGWQYRKAVVINNRGGELRDFQVSFMLNTWTLYTTGKLKDDCNDLRVTDETGQVLPHWIEPHEIGCPGNADHPKSRIWVRVPVIGNGATTVYVYYGNPKAPNSQSGKAVFDYFDDFTDDAAGEWEVVSGTAWTRGDGLYVNADVGNDTSAYRVLANGFMSENGVIEARVKLMGATIPGVNVDAGPAFRMVDAYNGYAVRVQADGVFALRKITDGESAHIAYLLGAVTPGAWHVVKAVYKGALLQAYLDGKLLIDTVDHAYRGPGRVGLYKDRGGKDDQAVFDWIFVRKYAPIEPVAKQPESEEQINAK